jgi:hypothetical protein
MDGDAAGVHGFYRMLLHGVTHSYQPWAGVTALGGVAQRPLPRRVLDLYF